MLGLVAGIYHRQLAWEAVIPALGRRLPNREELNKPSHRQSMPVGETTR